MDDFFTFNFLQTSCTYFVFLMNLRLRSVCNYTNREISKWHNCLWWGNFKLWKLFSSYSFCCWLVASNMTNSEPSLFLEILSIISLIIHIAYIVLPWAVYLLWWFSIMFFIWLISDVYTKKKIIKLKDNSNSFLEQFTRQHNESVKLSIKTFVVIIISTIFLCWWWDKLPWELFWLFERKLF